MNDRSRNPQDLATVCPGALTDLIRELAADPVPPDGGPEVLPGTAIGRFELRREIGRGGFGVVFEARDRELGRLVAFKLVRPGRDLSGHEQLQREAEAVAQLSHPNLVTLFEVGRSEHGPHLVFELLRGTNLERKLGPGPVEPLEAVRIAVEVARGLAHAHARGVIHRDLKPSNVFLCDDGRVKLLDFGMSHAFGRRRADGGTPGYMAPEQWRGAPEDERTDVFALGVILHRMLAGELPFPGEGNRGSAGALAPPELRVADMPALGPLVAQMLEKDPVQRPRDAGAVLEELLALPAGPATAGTGPGTGGSSGSSGSTGRVRVLRRRGRRLMLLLWGGAAAAAAVILAAGVFLGGGGLRRMPARGRALVAVADFVNESGDRELDNLSGLLITALEQSHRLQVLTRTRELDLLRQAGREGVERIDEALGREVSQRSGAALVLGTVRRFDELFSIDVRVVAPGRAEYLLAAREEGRGKAQIPALIDRLSERLRLGMEETQAELDAGSVRIASAVTNLEAYQHYFRGQRLVELESTDEAAAEFQRALAIDPGFALAHYELSRLHEWVGTLEELRAESQAALVSADRLPEKERYLVQAWKLHADGRDEEARALYARAIDAFPHDKNVLAAAAYHEYYQPEPGRAARLYERALALDPAAEAITDGLANCYALSGRGAEAVRLMRARVSRAPRDLAARQTLAGVLIATGQPEEGLEESRRAIAAAGSDAPGYLYSGIWLLLQAGRHAEAEESAAELIRGSYRLPSDADGVLSRRAYEYQLAVARAYQGRFREALEVLSYAYPKAMLLAGRGDLAAFRAAADEALGAAVPPGARYQHFRHFRLAAPVLFEYLGDPARAAEVAREIPPHPARRLYEALAAWRGARDVAPLQALVAEPGHTAVPFFLGEALLARGDARGAAEALRRFRRGFRGGLYGWLPDRPDLFDAWAHPRGLVLLARALEAQGDRAGAREAVERFLAQWRRADADLPLLAEGRALRARLGP